MSAKVSKLDRLHSKKLKKAYLREERENAELSRANVSADIVKYVPQEYYATEEPPFKDYEIDLEIPLSYSTLWNYNPLLLYRILKLMYGEPDILGACFMPNRQTFIPPTDWGYTLKVSNSYFAEIRSLCLGHRYVIRFFIPIEPLHKVIFDFLNGKISPDEFKASKDLKAFMDDLKSRNKRRKQELERFFRTLLDCMEKNGNLFHEKEEVKKSLVSGIANIFSQRYQAAEEMLALAESEKRPKHRLLEWEEEPEVKTHGSAYFSAAMFFCIALESLINTIFTVRLKKEFGVKLYERITHDLDLRFATAHVFCEGFERQILTPGSDLWNRFIKLRSFRNDVIHGNITPDNTVYSIPEDSTVFYYDGTSEFRGWKAEKEAARKYPRDIAGFSKKNVQDIQQTVDDIVEAILNAATEENRRWLESWLWGIVVFSTP